MGFQYGNQRHCKKAHAQLTMLGAAPSRDKVTWQKAAPKKRRGPLKPEGWTQISTSFAQNPAIALISPSHCNPKTLV